MLDSDLAELYGVQTRVLVQAVKRNLERFTKDFMAELRENFGFSAQDLGTIRAALIADSAYLCNEWRKVHGNP